MQVEHGSLTHLVMSALGGVDREYQKFYARLSELVSKKCDMNYSIAQRGLEGKFNSLDKVWFIYSRK